MKSLAAGAQNILRIMNLWLWLWHWCWHCFVFSRFLRERCFRNI